MLTSETRLTLGALRLLLGDPRGDPDKLDWAELRPLAERGVAVVRLADSITRRGEILRGRRTARCCGTSPRIAPPCGISP
ncbi:MAG: hypothetical protein Q8Q14_10125 [Gemmatimonadales bacterium]|nr:hypothetical protein [Gemmatimonadales bacterium]